MVKRMVESLFLDTRCVKPCLAGRQVIHLEGGKLKLFFVLSLLILISLYLSIPVSPTSAYYTNMSAEVVVGQPDFTSSSSGTSATSLNNPRGVATDGRRLFIADRLNHRVLIYNSIPTINNQSADVVIGQANFTNNSANQGGSASANTLLGPVRVATDGTKLFVADTGNNRVLIFNSIPTSNDASADVVVGQPDFTTTSSGTGANKTVGRPRGVYSDGNKLFIADTTGNRVLVYNSIPATNGASADVVVGQPDFTTTSAATTQSKLSFPEGLFSDGQRLYITDPGNSPLNNRILVWTSLPASNGAPADLVLGQPDFTTANAGSTTSSTFNGPRSVWVNKNRLFVGDGSNCRVMIWNSIPSTNMASADLVLGQPDFTTTCALVAANNKMRTPNSIVVYENKLFVTDSDNNRILIFTNVVATPSIGLYPFPEAAGNGRLRMRGNVRLGEWGRYGISGSKMEVSVFDPKPPPGGTSGYTLKFHATSSNADESFSFYFTPFEIKSMTTGYFPLITFKVNKDQFSRVGDNLAEYEVQVRKLKVQSSKLKVEEYEDWSTYLDNIPPNSNSTNNSLSTTYDETNGIITVKSKVKSLASGKYQIKVVAVDDWGSRQETPSLTFSTTGGITSAVIRPSYPLYSGFFPLQVNGIRGVTSGIISTLLSLTQPIYSSSTFTPTLRGIAFANSTVTMTITNKYNSKQQKTYTTKVNSNSTYTLTPTLYQSSTIDMWVLDSATNKYNELPPFQINVVQPQ
ncbi:NHL repeat-containing protein [Candidatus Woesebacteria bacterium]|nr:NHL repeat-containing protein [Candidatus Woesebacteria bacterium]